MSDVLPIVRFGDLDIGAVVGQGGVGTVSRLHHPPAELPGLPRDLVFKHYVPSIRSQVDDAALRRFIAFPASLDTADADLIRERLAWPLAAVYEDSRIVSGFLMPGVPPRYTLDIHGRSKAAGIEFLLNGSDYEKRLGIALDRTARLRLLLDLCRLIARLHTIGVTVGDLSPKNVLFSRADEPRCYLIDCDSMSIRGAHVLPPIETPGWQVPRGEDLSTPASDSYKFTLMAIRLFAQDQDTHDFRVLHKVSPALGRLAMATTTAPPAARPQISAWVAPLESELEASAEAASQTLPQRMWRPSPTASSRPQYRPSQPRPAKWFRRLSPPRAPKARLLLLAALVVITLVVLSLTHTR
ncbi:lipopolysaccharide kinase InaA family protein [Streptomyces sp. WAC04114]|uniref:lipopolysaccharide kinase InaA family protein n=1 Tax=Streptomyces sp. WAC04114 TaxID=2867961 RepID=UPI001C8B5773|nr:lipopolysaccharide kinase InaA family protein [Streptomyces sp. WAC04114]MBX9363201.1 hypothetical protein [Streptomyces sp. WAC04114]